MQIAYHTLNFGLWKNPDDEKVLAAIRRAGYDAVEGLLYEDPSKIRSLLEKSGLTLTAVYMSGHLMGMDDAQIREEAKRLVALGKAVGVSIAGGFVSRSDGKAHHSYGTCDEHYVEVARRLESLGRILADGGMTLTVHNHIDNMTETEEELDILLDGTDSRYVGLLFDTAHAVCGGSDPVRLCKKYASRIKHLHIKDTENLLHGRPYFFKNRFTPLGEGVIDFPSIFEILKRSGYAGAYCVELDASVSSNPDPEASAKISREYLRKHLQV